MALAGAVRRRAAGLVTLWLVALVGACASTGDQVVVDLEAGVDVSVSDGGAPAGDVAMDLGTGGCRSASDCYGGDFCTSARECRSGRCVTVRGVPNCDDGITCTVDGCDAARGACTHEPADARCPMGRYCDPAQSCIAPPTCEAGDTPCRALNHDPCGGVWSCDPQRLVCVRSDPMRCDDQNPCTIDRCERNGDAARCVHETVVNDCAGRVCNPSPSGCHNCGPCNGACIDDGRTCLACGPCEVLAGGRCVPAMDGASCGTDNVDCTIDQCLGGTCQHTIPPDLGCGAQACGPSPRGCGSCGTCGAGLFCQMGACRPCPDCQGWDGTRCAPLANGSPCTDDGSRCTTDLCQSGTCRHESRANDCGARVCGMSPSGCFSCAPGCTNAACVDGACQPCPPCQYHNGERCVPVTNGLSCASDSDACTQDICREGACVHPAVVPDCTGLECGPVNGCGSCGTCMNGPCVNGRCQSGCPTCQMWSGSACVPIPGSVACATDSDVCTSDVCSAGVCTHPRVANDCGSRQCGLSASGCFTCGAGCGTGMTCAEGTCVCAAGLSLCGGACVDLQSNAANCGACGRACGARERCEAGACVISSCPSGEALCGGACVNVQTSATNCGGCGRTCPSGQHCASGACACTSGTLCSGACVNTQSDSANCGACGRACPSGQRCEAGSCACTSGTLCSGACVDTAGDAANCGGCGRACGSGQRCTAGACVCTSGTLCSGACVNTQSDSANCGACGRACPSGQYCSSGGCACTSGTLCNGACRNTQSDSANCGACGRSCPSGQYCSSGSCACSSGTLCGSACTNTQSDSANCGACGRSCGSGQYCSGGNCYCNSGSLCGGSCVNTGSDFYNCGSCGRACASGQYCSGGGCYCSSGTLCGGSCVNTGSDFYNCGGCGRSCSSGQTCTSGSCVSPVPDLTITRLSPPGTVGRGIYYQVPVTVQRTGGALTSGTYVSVRIYLSTDSNITTSDYVASLGYAGSQFSNAQLNANGSLTQNVECAPGDIALGTLPTGFYYWGAIVDWGNSHSESSESNNVYVGGSVTVY